jgi:hypothetical protein
MLLLNSNGIKGMGSITAMLLFNSNVVKGVGEYNSNVVT